MATSEQMNEPYRLLRDWYLSVLEAIKTEDGSIADREKPIACNGWPGIYGLPDADVSPVWDKRQSPAITLTPW